MEEYMKIRAVGGHWMKTEQMGVGVSRVKYFYRVFSYILALEPYQYTTY